MGVSSRVWEQRIRLHKCTELHGCRLFAHTPCPRLRKAALRMLAHGPHSQTRGRDSVPSISWPCPHPGLFSVSCLEEEGGDCRPFLDWLATGMVLSFLQVRCLGFLWKQFVGPVRGKQTPKDLPHGGHLVVVVRGLESAAGHLHIQGTFKIV